MLTPAKKALVRHMVVRAVDERDAKASGRPVASALTDKQFAETLGLHFKTIAAWKQDAEVVAAFDAGMREYESSRDYFRSCMRAKAIEELWVNYSKAVEPHKRQYLAIVLEQTKDADASDEVVDFSDMTDADLINAVLCRDLSVLGMTSAELAAHIKKGESWTPPQSPQSSEPSEEQDCSLPDSPQAGTPETKPESHRVKATPPSRKRKRRSPTRSS